MCFCMDCVCLCVCVRVYASVCQTLTAIASDTKWLFSEGFAPFHVLIASLWWQGGPLLRAALSHDSCNIYMFTLTISICCFWNNQQQRPGENGCKSRSTWVSWLGGWAWLCSAWVEGSSRRGGVVDSVFFSSRPSQGFWWRAGSKRGALGICSSLPSERCFTRVRSVVAPRSWANWLGPSSLIDFRYDTKINCKGSYLVKTHF